MLIKNNTLILFIIVIAQFFCTSLWFAGNAIVRDFIYLLELNQKLTATITSTVQLGFILGTLCFAFLSISDKFSPSKVFLVCAILGSLSNLLPLLFPTYPFLLLSRWAVGFWLAGIYPVGMKIAADYHEKGLGLALGYLVGALVLGTALPYMLNFLSGEYDYQYVLTTTSILALAGGSSIGLLKDGPYRKKTTSKLQLLAAAKIFQVKTFKRAAFGYFGHMWELYTFWALIPMILTNYLNQQTIFLDWNIDLLAFTIIASGLISCVAGGYFSKWFGSAKVAFSAQLISLVCCLLSPISPTFPPLLFLQYLLVWGLSVVADSPQFSSLVAQYAPAENKGTALTITNSFGFSITIISILLMQNITKGDNIFNYLPLLSIGPIIGLLFFYPLVKEKKH